MLRFLCCFSLVCAVLAFPYQPPAQPMNLEDFLSVIGLRSLPFPEPARPRNASVTYAYTEWSNYTECSKVCGGGMMERTRRCLTSGGQEVATHRCSQAPGAHRSPLDLVRRYWKGSGYKVEIQQKPCNEQTCVVTLWSDWGECDRACGGGSQRSSRMCLESKEQSKCNFQRSKMRRCNTQDCYRMSEWAAWGACSRDCGGGVKSRTRQCEPALNSTHTEYTNLAYVLRVIKPSYGGMQGSGYRPSGTSNDVLFHYLSKYLDTCTDSLFESGPCNNHACPSCPHNQIHYQCKPCPQHCRDVPVAFPYLSGRNFYPFMNNYHLSSYLYGHVTGCNGVCEAGCGCPLLQPLLGPDGRCYSLPILCPPAHIYAGVSSTNMPPSHGRNFYSTNMPTTSTNPPAVATTTVGFVDEEREGTEDTEQPPPEVAVPNGEEDTAALAACQYDVMIATRPGVAPCRCDGELETVPCYTNGDTSCPVVCRRIAPPLLCPPVTLYQNKTTPPSTTATCEDKCSSNTDCAVGDLCCNTACGRDCVNGVTETL